MKRNSYEERIKNKLNLQKTIKKELVLKKLSISSKTSWDYEVFTARELKSPEWFNSINNKDPIDVSIIIPMYNAKDYIKAKIESWTHESLINWEIIYVDDNCPQSSNKQVLKSWKERRNEFKKPIGRIIKTNENSGFIGSNNAGAKFARGRYICLLNADVTVIENWLTSMFNLIEQNKEIGIVGNFQYNEDGKIDSLGSEWSWNTYNFPHIGRNILNSQPIKQLTEDQIPKKELIPQERDMVTGSCLLIRRNIWETLQGFDTVFKKGYWEDSDLCMRTKNLGYKVYFDPNSKIIHKVGHSNSGGNPEVLKNAMKFSKRYVETGRINEFISSRKKIPPPNIKQYASGPVKACIIACNEEEFLEASVESVKDLITDMTIVVGGNRFALKAGMCDDKGYPKDNTLKIAYNLVEKYGGNVIEPPGRPWKDKIEQRNAHLDFLNNDDWMMILDGDEVYDSNQLWRIAELTNFYDVLTLQYFPFWNNLKTLGNGKWNEYPAERMVKFKEGYSYKKNNHCQISDSTGRIVQTKVKTYRGEEKLFYHYGWIRPIEKIRQKLLYYKNQSGIDNLNYVNDIFLEFRKNKESIKNTHPMGEGGFESFLGIHPVEIQKIEHKLLF